MEEKHIPQPKKEGFFQRIFKWPKISFDLNKKDDRRRFLFVNLALIIALSIFGYVNLELFHYSESSEFCGTTCHTMDPQYVRYEHSEHAKVECVECHVGEGLEYFIEAKWNGMRQVYQMVTNSYPTPIKGPVHNLRPARDTCENCHSPTTFKNNIVSNIVHYDNDFDNTKVQSNLILKMGGWQQGSGVGIHWHVSNKVYYIAADHERQVILWVGIEQDDGTLKEYYARDAVAMAQSDFVEEAFEKGEVREMDCIDCHNRAAHYTPTPQESIDSAINLGLVSQDIPFIRANALELLSTTYETEAAAHLAMDGLVTFYANDDSLAKYNNEKLLDAINVLKEIYSETTFPEMESDWRTSPNNVRHTASPGCFRCHDGNHVLKDAQGEGEDGDVISVKCNLCHTVPIVGRGDDLVIEAPVIVGDVPVSHIDFRWTIEHRDISEADKQECLECHGNGFCNNGVCHNLSHPEDMLFTHPEEYAKTGGQVCYNCHQDITCARCHPGGIIENP